MDGGCIVVGVLASPHGIEARPNVAPERFRLLITLNQQTQAFTYDFIGCSIHARGNPFLHDSFQFGGERYVHLTQPYPCKLKMSKTTPRSARKHNMISEDQFWVQETTECEKFG